MPITADLNGKNYTLGRGRVFFDRFPNNVVVNALTKGDGFRYLGNTPEFSTTSEAETLDHFDSDQGIKTKDASVQLQLTRSGSFTCDNIDAENIALFFMGDADTLTQAAATGVIDTFTGARRGRFLQLGVTEANPSGVRKVSNVVVKKGAGFTTVVAMSGNYEVDADLGRIYIEADAPGIDNVDIQITYDVAASTREQVISGSTPIYGSLHFVSENTVGVKRDYLIPYVKLSPSGDYNLKGDEWQSMTFDFEVLKKGANVADMYIDGRPA